MASFPDSCPQCGAPWDHRPELIGRPAVDFDSCAFRCLNCGIGFSNAKPKGSRIRITAGPQLNVPAQVRTGLDRALAEAINVHNRPTKHQKFCSANSEDAVTWTVVRGLQSVGTVSALVGRPNLGEPQAVLLWGYPIDGSRAATTHERLVAISDKLGEKPDRRSEPDVIVVWPGLMAFVEAKYGSANDRQPNYAGYSTYLPAPGLFRVSNAAIMAQGSYQLMRNWVIGAALAAHLGVPFELVNLGPSGIAKHAAEFAALLEKTSGRRFEHRTWQQVLDAAPIPGWLRDYSTKHGLARWISSDPA